jgi:hypothetical protein
MVAQVQAEKNQLAQQRDAAFVGAAEREVDFTRQQDGTAVCHSVLASMPAAGLLGTMSVVWGRGLVPTLTKNVTVSSLRNTA